MDNRKVSCAFFRDITINNSLKLQYKFFISSYRSIILLSEFTSLTTQNKRNFSLHLSSQKLFFFLTDFTKFWLQFYNKKNFCKPSAKIFSNETKKQKLKIYRLTILLNASAHCASVSSSFCPSASSRSPLSGSSAWLFCICMLFLACSSARKSFSCWYRSCNSSRQEFPPPLLSSPFSPASKSENKFGFWV